MSSLPPGVSSTTINFSGVLRTAYFREDSTDSKVFEAVFKYAVYDLSRFVRWSEIHAYLLAEREAGRQALLVDAGANIGASSLFLSFIAPNVKVLALEPELGNFEMLQRNTAGLNCECLLAALADEPGRVKVVDVGRGSWAFRTEPTSSEQGSVPAYSMNQLYETYCSDTLRPFAVKIDIEGGEDEVFSKNLEWIKRTPIIMMETHDWMFPKKGIGKRVLKALIDEPFDFLITTETLLAIRWEL